MYPTYRHAVHRIARAVSVVVDHRHANGTGAGKVTQAREYLAACTLHMVLTLHAGTQPPGSELGLPSQ
jgi:hypothetical protein